MSFILLCGTTIVPLNHFDNFVYISLYLYGGNVHFFVAYLIILGVRWGGNTINSLSKPSKPRISLPQTSDVCATNLGTFHRRSPMFSVSGHCFMRKFPDFRPFCPEIPNLQPLFFSPPVPPLLGSEALLSAPKSQIILTKFPSSSSRQKTRKTHFLGIQSWHGNYIPLTTMCFFLMTLRAERFTSKSLVLVERQKP